MITLPDLPYSYTALAPRFSSDLLETHHVFHHRAYVTAANEALEQLARWQGDEHTSEYLHLLKHYQFNLAGHVLHSLYWMTMSPDPKPASDEFRSQIQRNFGSASNLQSAFISAITKAKGSGWVLLGYDSLAKRLGLFLVDRHEFGLPAMITPVLACDVWEHAYYLDYKADRDAYAKAFLEVLDWAGVEARWRTATGIAKQSQQEEVHPGLSLKKRHTVAIDFDKTIHAEGPNHEYGPPVRGAKDALEAFKDSGFDIVIASCRAGFSPDEPSKMEAWLKDNQIPFDKVTSEKPLAHLYIDDKGLRFEGDWKKTLEVALPILAAARDKKKLRDEPEEKTSQQNMEQTVNPSFALQWEESYQSENQFEDKDLHLGVLASLKKVFPNDLAVQAAYDSAHGYDSSGYDNATEEDQKLVTYAEDKELNMRVDGGTGQIDVDLDTDLSTNVPQMEDLSMAGDPRKVNLRG